MAYVKTHKLHSLIDALDYFAYLFFTRLLSAIRLRPDKKERADK